MVNVDWWDAVGCTQSAAEDGIGKNVQTCCYIIMYIVQTRGLSEITIFHDG